MHNLDFKKEKIRPFYAPANDALCLRFHETMSLRKMPHTGIMRIMIAITLPLSSALIGLFSLDISKEFEFRRGFALLSQDDHNHNNY